MRIKYFRAANLTIMSLKAIWAQNSSYSKLMLATGVILFSAVLFTLLASVSAMVVYGIGMTELQLLLSDFSNPRTISIFKFIQTISGIGVFIIPALVLAYVFDEQPNKYLSLTVKVNSSSVILASIALLVALPFINFLGELNAHLSLPSFLAGVENWMRESEANAAELTKSFLTMNAVSDLYINLFVIALLPALGEELLFRGIVQRLFTDWSGNKHLAVWISAALFSAMHMQFYGFLPRMLLGALFGYLLVWSGSLWLPIIGHFVNNAAAVIATYLFKEEMMSLDPDKIGTESDYLAVVASIVITGALLWSIYRRETVKNYSTGVQ